VSTPCQTSHGPKLTHGAEICCFLRNPCCSWTTRGIAAVVLLVLAACSGPKKIGPAPPQFKTLLNTSKGRVVILVHRDWAPIGADRFYELVKIHYYDDNYFYRALKGFIVQWGLNGDDKVSKDWIALTIKDDPRKQDNLRGRVSFAKQEEPNSRSTTVFINLANNKLLDDQGFVPFGEVVEGMDTVDHFYMEYGEGPPEGEGPDPKAVLDLGNGYIWHHFDKLDSIRKATILE
jgi:peptidyl-prolyl cis-trans isomerase A (cyclophilin A)